MSKGKKLKGNASGERGDAVQRRGAPGKHSAAHRAYSGVTSAASARAAAAPSSGRPLQRRSSEPASIESDPSTVREIAASGVASAGGAMPYEAEIAASFGVHGGALEGVSAHIGGAAADAAGAIGASAYATGSKVAFASAPDLHTSAHEAAHVVQQRAGVQLDGGVGRAGDDYERHADAVADRVVAGRSSEDLLDQIHGPAPSARGEVQRKEPTTGFDEITKKGLKKKDAPTTIVLPDELTAGMQKSWDASLPGGKAQEQGGNLVRNKDGSYGWRQGDAGTAGMFSPDYDDVGSGQTLIGVGHTHPYGKDEGGHTDVSFSGGDISSIVWEQQPLNIVQSGETLFVIARTAEFEALLKGLDDDGLEKLEARIDKCWDQVFKNTKGSIQKRAAAATVATCKEFHLVYYSGKGKELSREV